MRRTLRLERKLKFEYKYLSQGLIYYGPKHQKAQRSDEAETKTLQKI